MILILSEPSDLSTDDIIDWINSFGARFLRINGADLDCGSRMSLLLNGDNLEVDLEISGVHVDFSEVRAVWFRRWIRERRHESQRMLRDYSDFHSPKLSNDLIVHLTRESRRVSELFFSQFSEVPWLSTPDTSALNKLDVLKRAARIGIDTPATLITTRREDLLIFAKHYKEVITKTIGEVRSFISDDRSFYSMRTSVLTQAEIESLPEYFAPSLFQERVAKAFELRVFFLDSEFYAMAIFSQLDPQTQVDFRVYNFKRPNRCVPYRLSENMVSRLQELAADIGLNTGSADLIVTPDGRHIFLEINPVGQFGMVSKPCNYHLERKVAEHLIEVSEHG